MIWLTGTATVIWFIFMTTLSHQTGEETARTREQLTRGIHITNKAANKVFLSTTAHIVCFFILTGLLLTTLRLAKANVWFGIIGVTLWAWGDEWSKQFVPGRHYDLMDVGKNLIGVGLGGSVLLLIMALV